MAEEIVKVLRRLASRGKTVLCTIHQPASEVFARFDTLMLLAEGRLVYYGPSPKSALNVFADAGLHCPSAYNPADYFIEQLAVISGNEEKAWHKIQAVSDAYENSESCKQLALEVTQFSGETDVFTAE